MLEFPWYRQVAAAAVILPASALLLRNFLRKADASSGPSVAIPLYGENPSRHEKYIFVEVDYVGVVLGRHLRNVRRIEYETRTFINLISYGPNEMANNKDALRAYENGCYWDNEDEVPPEKDGRLHFLRVHAQTAEQIKLVELAIEALITDAKRRKNKEEMQIPIESVGYVIGKGGDRIKKLSKQYRVRAVITQDGGDYEKVVLEGTPEGIEGAKTRILEMVDYSTRLNMEDDVEVDVEEQLRQMVELKEKLEDAEEMW